MAGKRKYTAAQVVEALQACQGLVYLAARRLGCSPTTIWAYRTRFKTVRDAVRQKRGELVDTAELALLQGVQQGAPWAVTFVLKHLGRGRGYVERQEVTGKEGGQVALEIVERIVHAKDPSNLRADTGPK
jgi:hypothetical protein